MKLGIDQRITLRRVEMAAADLHRAMETLNMAWTFLEKNDCPIGFMDTMYPFKDKFDTVVEDTKQWRDHISAKVNELLNQLQKDILTAKTKKQ